MPEESAFVVALRSQVEYGNYDASQAATVQYPAVIEKYLPKHLRAIAAEDIAAHHLKLRDLGKQECNLRLMKFIMSWPLFGVTIFEVLVNRLR